MIKCLKLLWGQNSKMDGFLMNAFVENLIKVYSNEHCQPKLRVFILSIWKIASSNYQVMATHLKKARTIIHCCLEVTELNKDNILAERDLQRDLALLRYSILYNLSSEFINIFAKWDFDKYQIAGLIVDYLNNVPCPPAQIKVIQDRFKLSTLDISKKEFVRLSQNVKTNSAFNFIWISFWIGAEVTQSNLVASESKSKEIRGDVGRKLLQRKGRVHWSFSYSLSRMGYRKQI